MRILFYVFIAGAIFLGGCIGLIGTPLMGSKGEVVDAVAIRHLSYVEIMPLYVNRGGNISMPEQDSLDAWFRNSIASGTTFKIVNKDSLERSESYRNLYKVNGAKIFGKISFRREQDRGTNVEFAIVVKSNLNDNILAYSSHDTYLGNSYFFRPDIRELTQDGITGALNKLEKIIKESTGSGLSLMPMPRNSYFRSTFGSTGVFTKGDFDMVTYFGS